MKLLILTVQFYIWLFGCHVYFAIAWHIIRSLVFQKHMVRAALFCLLLPGWVTLVEHYDYWRSDETEHTLT